MRFQNQIQALKSQVVELLDGVKGLTQEYKLRQKMEQRYKAYKAQFKESKNYIDKLIKSTLSARTLLKQTLQVKLRYEEIIKNVIANETKT